MFWLLSSHESWIFVMAPGMLNPFQKIFNWFCPYSLEQSPWAQFSSVVSDSATPWTTARQASLSVTNSRNLLKLMSVALVMPFNHLILCHAFLLLPSMLPSIRVFSNDQFFTSSGQRIGISAATSVLPMNTQDWSPLGWTGWISLQSKGLSRVLSNTTSKALILRNSALFIV